MGRIYEQLKQNIDFLNEIDRRLRNNERLNMHEIWEVQKAVLNIEYVVNYTETSLEGAVGEERLANGNNKSFNIPNNFEQMVNEWEKEFDEEQVDNVVEHLKTNQRVPSYSPEINEPDPVRYFEYVTGTLDNIVPTVTRGHFGPTAEAFKSLTNSARQDYVDTALEQNFVMEPKGRIARDIYPWLTSPHERYMGDVGADNPENYLVRAQRDLDNYEREELLDDFQKRFKNNLTLAKGISKVENATNNEHALADAIRDGVEKYTSADLARAIQGVGSAVVATRLVKNKIGDVKLAKETNTSAVNTTNSISSNGVTKTADEVAAAINGKTKEEATKALGELFKNNDTKLPDPKAAELLDNLGVSMKKGKIEN